MSDHKTVYIRDVDLKSSGEYKCEVSAEAPSFETVEKKRKLTVVRK